MPRSPRKRATRGACGSCNYTTRAEIEATVAQLVEQTHERLLEAEQAAVGWGGCQEVRGA